MGSYVHRMVHWCTFSIPTGSKWDSYWPLMDIWLDMRQEALKQDGLVNLKAKCVTFIGLEIE